MQQEESHHFAGTHDIGQGKKEGHIRKNPARFL